VTLNVLSLFDGISCGQLALQRAGVVYDKYYASEVDKHAMEVTQSNYPHTVQMGDVTTIGASALPKVNLLIGGSPCQGFSVSGKQMNFDDHRSRLFFEYVRLLDECKPEFFLLENVVMAKKHQDVISGYLGVQPIKINSNLFSAQSRDRLYWTNIPSTPLPTSNSSVVRDILNVDTSYISTISEGVRINGRARPTNSSEAAGQTLLFVKGEVHSSRTGLVFVGGLMSPNRKFRSVDGKLYQGAFPQGTRVYSVDGKSPTLNASCISAFYKDENGIRKLSRTENERLQTVPEGYTRVATEGRANKALGNGWTVDVVAHILKGIHTRRQDD